MAGSLPKGLSEGSSTKRREIRNSSASPEYSGQNSRGAAAPTAGSKTVPPSRPEAVA